jgi:hypothetical protein
MHPRIVPVVSGKNLSSFLFLDISTSLSSSSRNIPYCKNDADIVSNTQVVCGFFSCRNHIAVQPFNLQGTKTGWWRVFGMENQSPSPPSEYNGDHHRKILLGR